MKAAFFDVDYVVYSGAIGREFFEYLCKNGIFPKEGLKEINRLNKLFEDGKLEILHFLRKLINLWCRCIKGRKKEEIENAARNLMKEKKKNINKKIKGIIDELKEEYLIIAVSGSPIEIIRALSEYVHFDHIIATEFEEYNGIYTGGVKFPLVGGNGKKEKIVELSKKLNIDLKKSKAFGDSLLDLEMLEIVGEPIAVNPKKDLRKISEKYGWKII